MRERELSVCVCTGSVCKSNPFDIIYIQPLLRFQVNISIYLIFLNRSLMLVNGHTGKNYIFFVINFLLILLFYIYSYLVLLKKFFFLNYLHFYDLTHCSLFINYQFTYKPLGVCTSTSCTYQKISDLMNFRIQMKWILLKELI